MSCTDSYLGATNASQPCDASSVNFYRTPATTMAPFQHYVSAMNPSHYLHEMDPLSSAAYRSAVSDQWHHTQTLPQNIFGHQHPLFASPLASTIDCYGGPGGGPMSLRIKMEELQGRPNGMMPHLDSSACQQNYSSSITTIPTSVLVLQPNGVHNDGGSSSSVFCAPSPSKQKPPRQKQSSKRRMSVVKMQFSKRNIFVI
jgi:hypothetical protein